MKRWRLFGPLAAAAVALPLAVGCSSDSPTATATASSSAAPASSRASTAGGAAQRTSACRPVPAPARELDWLPADLPLPPDTYATADTESPSTTSDADAESGNLGTAQRGFLVVKMTVEDFKAFVAANWPSAGYSLGKGDSEAGEAEAGYRKGDFGGAYRVRDVYCDPTMSELLLTYGKGA